LTFPFVVVTPSQVAKDIWVCDNKTIKPWQGDIVTYKESLKKQILSDSKARGQKARMCGANTK
jgi:hypothetical protein